MAARGLSTIGFVGAGRLAASLAAALVHSGHRVTAVASANLESARALARSLDPEVSVVEDAVRVAEVADIVFLAVPDSAIAGACRAIRWEPRHVAVHCSGALGLDALETARRAGAVPACFHPLQTFPSRVPQPERFNGIFCGVEGAEPASSFLESIAKDLGARPFRLEGVDRALYHAAAVMVSNLVVALAASATRLWGMAGLDTATGREALSPLLVAAAENVSKLDLERALTGPVARGDVETVRGHLAALKADPELLEIYRLLSAALVRLPLGHNAATLAALRQVLEP